MILHITTRELWERAGRLGVYRGDTLDSEGFIHCSNVQQVVPVANALFRGRSGLVILCIEADRVGAEIRYEGLDGGERFPHIYGPLQIGAVALVLDFEPGEEGTFALPEHIEGLG